jgi:hypothetical protein
MWKRISNCLNRINNIGDEYKMSKYKHTEETAKLFNKILDDYNKIQSDSTLEERGLLYSDYIELGILIDRLRYDGKTVTQTENITKYFKNLGCVIKKEKDNYIAKLK